MTPAKRKRVRETAQVSAAKRPREAIGTNSEKPTWGVSLLDQSGPFGRGISADDAAEILDFLPRMEKLTWNEVLKNRRDGGNHQVAVRLICSAAQKRLEQRGIETDALISLRVTGEKRIWGIRQGSVLHLLWWDPEHEVYPTKRRHT